MRLPGEKQPRAVDHTRDAGVSADSSDTQNAPRNNLNMVNVLFLQIVNKKCTILTILF